MSMILIADDDKDDQMLIAAAFQRNGISYPLVFLNDGIELIEHFERVKLKQVTLPAFILLDLNMPRLSGKQVLRRLKNDPLLRRIPILVFSTSQSASEIEECYDLGANCYIVKPDSFDSLVDISAQLHLFWTKVAALPAFN